jgi:hypothetical protein
MVIVVLQLYLLVGFEDFVDYNSFSKSINDKTVSSQRKLDSVIRTSNKRRSFTQKMKWNPSDSERKMIRTSQRKRLGG